MGLEEDRKALHKRLYRESVTALDLWRSRWGDGATWADSNERISMEREINDQNGRIEHLERELKMINRARLYEFLSDSNDDAYDPELMGSVGELAQTLSVPEAEEPTPEVEDPLPPRAPRRQKTPKLQIDS